MKNEYCLSQDNFHYQKARYNLYLVKSNLDVLSTNLIALWEKKMRQQIKL